VETDCRRVAWFSAKIVREIIAGNLVRATCPDSPDSSCMLIWSADIHEQIDQLLLDAIDDTRRHNDDDTAISPQDCNTWKALNSKVAAVNNANRIALALHPVLYDIFAPLVGQKVVTADGVLKTKVARLMPALPDTDVLRVHRPRCQESLTWTVTTWTLVNHGAAGDYKNRRVEQHRAAIDIGTLDNGVLIDVESNMDPLRVDYNVDEIWAEIATLTAARKAEKRSQRAIRAAINKLSEFL